nr:MAG TPA: hypothetical protein [Caudoviricetes sp.]
MCFVIILSHYFNTSLTRFYFTVLYSFRYKKKENRVYNSVGRSPHTMCYMRRNGNPISD